MIYERENGDHFHIYEVLGDLCHNWHMHNAFVFDARHGMKPYLRKLKGVLM